MSYCRYRACPVLESIFVLETWFQIYLNTHATHMTCLKGLFTTDPCSARCYLCFSTSSFKACLRLCSRLRIVETKRMKCLHSVYRESQNPSMSEDAHPGYMKYCACHSELFSFLSSALPIPVLATAVLLLQRLRWLWSLPRGGAEPSKSCLYLCTWYHPYAHGNILMSGTPERVAALGPSTEKLMSIADCVGLSLGALHKG